jgi:hypothetical protein
MRRRAEGDEDPYALWHQFLDEKYEGGKKLVENTNPASKDTYDKVQMATRMKHDIHYRKERYQEYLEWLKDLEGEQEDPAAEHEGPFPITKIVEHAPDGGPFPQEYFDALMKTQYSGGSGAEEAKKPPVVTGEAVTSVEDVKDGDIVFWNNAAFRVVKPEDFPDSVGHLWVYRVSGDDSVYGSPKGQVSFWSPKIFKHTGWNTHEHPNPDFSQLGPGQAKAEEPKKEEPKEAPKPKKSPASIFSPMEDPAPPTDVDKVLSPDPEPTPEPAPEPKKEEPKKELPALKGGKKITKPSQIKDGDIVKYYDKNGDVKIGHVIDSAGSWFDVQPLDMKAGEAKGSSAYFDADNLGASGMIRIPPSKHPAKAKKYLQALEDAKLGDAKPAPEEPKTVTSPDEVKVGDFIAYQRKGKDLIGKIVAHDGDKFHVEVLDPKTGMSADYKTRHFTADRMKDFGAKLMPNWKPPEPSATPKPAKPAKPKKPKKKPHVEPKADVDAEGWKVIGGQGGATDGASYETPDGTRYYVKTPTKLDHIQNEMLANDLYREAGIDVPDLSVVMRNGMPSIASRWVDGLKLDPTKLKGGGVPGVAEGFAMDAWLANWDVVGQTNKSYQNMPIGPDGKAWRIDAGGAMQYHGALNPKGSAFGPKVKELESFVEPHRDKAAVYKHVTPQQIVESIDRVLAISEDKIDEIIAKHYPKDSAKRKQLAETLKARRKSLEEQRDKYVQKGKTASLQDQIDRLLKLAAQAKPPLPKSFFTYLRLKYGPQGGQTKVHNTTETSDRYDKVEVFTLMRNDETFRKSVYDDYHRWLAQWEEAEKEFEKNPPQVDVDQEGWEQIGRQGGSNPGGLYEDKGGNQWYVKTPRTADHAKNEILAGKLYELAGVSVPELVPARRQGQFSVASKIIPGLEEDREALRDGTVDGVLEHMATDAWLANWDVVGLSYDNLLVDEDGQAHRVDTGGAMRYRAMGSPKGDKFGPKVQEFKAFLDPKRKAGSVFHHADGQDVADSIKDVLDIPADKIEKLVEQYGPTDDAERNQLLETLEARRRHLKAMRDYLIKEGYAE